MCGQSRSFPRLFLIIVCSVMTSYRGSKAARITIPDSAAGTHMEIVLTFYYEKLSWNEAQAACKTLDNNGHLAILDAEIYDKVVEFAIGIWDSQWNHAWVGLHWTQISGTNTRVWADNKCTIATNTFSNYKDEPNMEYDSSKKCFVLESGLGLERKPCDNEEYFICQHYKEATPPPLFTSYSFSMMTATPTTNCVDLCNSVSGCFISYEHLAGSSCILAVAGGTGESYIKNSPDISGLMTSNLPLATSNASPTPNTCVPSTITLSGLPVVDISSLESPQIGVTCPTIPTTTTAAAETTVTITTAPPPPPPTTTTRTTTPTTTTSTTTTTEETTTTTTAAAPPATTTITTPTPPPTTTTLPPPTPPPTTTTTTTAEPATTTTSTTETPTTSTSTPTTTTASASSSPSTTATTTAIPLNTPPPITANASTVIKALIEELKLDVRKTSKFKAKLTSAYDPRKSSQYIGLGGILLLSSIGFFIILFDLPTFFKNIKTICPCFSSRSAPLLK